MTLKRLPISPRSGAEALASEAVDLKSWLFEQALPVWWSVGADRTAGGFYEKITQANAPTGGHRRTRVVGRQVYSFATAASMGWTGPAAEAVDHGLTFFFDKCLLPSGLLVSQVTPNGQIVRPDFDLYDHAFGLFGLAAAMGQPAQDRDRLAAAAATIRDRMIAGFAHPYAGFYECLPAQAPLKANPHMHIFEASLAWIEATKPDADPRWHALADQIAELALAKFIQPGGHLIEFFDLDWNPVSDDSGRIVEPGHQFEWAWLMIRWGRMRGRPDAIAAGRRLIELAETHGVCQERGVTFNEVWTDMSPKDEVARLWPQTERIKAHLLASTIAAGERDADAHLLHAAEACRALKRYLATPIAGLWFDRVNEAGQPIAEDAPTSSLYHIVCALNELDVWHRSQYQIAGTGPA